MEHPEITDEVLLWFATRTLPPDEWEEVANKLRGDLEARKRLQEIHDRAANSIRRFNEYIERVVNEKRERLERAFEERRQRDALRGDPVPGRSEWIEEGHEEGDEQD